MFVSQHDGYGLSGNELTCTIDLPFMFIAFILGLCDTKEFFEIHEKKSPQGTVEFNVIFFSLTKSFSKFAQSLVV